MSFFDRTAFLAFAAALCLPFAGTEAEDISNGALVEVPFAQLPDRSLAPLGQAALAIHPSEWKHAQSANFIYHYFHSYAAAPVSVEAEFYYRLIARELGKEGAAWERKSHIFAFETADEWSAFQQRGALDPWTGGVHSKGELFIRRDPAFRFKDNTLGHEVAHLVVDRFFGSNVPLWLNEGYAEYVSRRCYASFMRARNFRSRPTSSTVPSALFIPLADLTTAVTYPQETAHVEAFYAESERLVRFLSGVDKNGFGAFFESLSKGARFETALAKGFGGRFPGLDGLQREFKEYALHDTGSTISD